jgi:diguanylate cyclase (GGDEF)-like protein
MANDTFLRDWVIHGEQDVSKITRYLNEIKEKYNAFTSFFVSEKTFIYYQAKGILKKVSPKEPRDIWYFRVREMKDDFEINVDPDMANKDTMTIFINYKVYDYKQNYIGATGVGLNVTAVKTLIEEYQKRYKCNVFFVDKTGKIVLYGTEYKKEKDNINGIPGLNKISKKILSGEVKNYSYFKKGNIIHLYTRYIDEFKWYLFVEQTENQALKGILFTLFINLLICIAISIIVLMITNITLSLYQKRIEKMAITDKLTGLYNRQIFDVSVDLSLKEYNRYKKAFSVIMLDIDNFKAINDTYGHLAGDEVLRHITQKINSNIRDTDTVFRWGGEEFVILLNDCSGNNAYNIAEKIRIEIQNSKLIFNDKEIFCTVSIGVTQSTSNELESDLISRADHCLYMAKQKGKNNTVLG